MRRQSIIFKAPFRIDIAEEVLPEPASNQVLIQTRFSAISHGTEMLIYRGRFPAEMAADEIIPEMQHPLHYPLKYGYAAVGDVIDIGSGVDPDLMGQTVFCLHPHESSFIARADSVIPLPADIDPGDALFLANMETAVNLLMDGKPVIGEKVVVFGQGVVGLLTTSLLAEFPLGLLLTLEPIKLRREMSLKTGARLALDPTRADSEDQLVDQLGCGGAGDGADLVYELSGNPNALEQAMAITGFNGRIFIGSWYGDRPAALDLGSRFHRQRLRLISSQVSTLTPDLAARWSRQRRFDVAWDMIRRLRPSKFISQWMPLSRAGEAYDLIDKDPAATIQLVLEYEHG
ncbi:MAG: hypothetical protein PVI13_06340 [Desulfobacterales bacterium]|jgi:2-desacetyl-2-hydroxyethyl bacteriochlorophyllide A dehydrogenase